MPPPNPLFEDQARSRSPVFEQESNRGSSTTSGRKSINGKFDKGKAAGVTRIDMGTTTTGGRTEKIPTLHQRLGLDDFYNLEVWRASTYELLGTALLVMMIDAIIISTFEAKISAPTLTMSVLIAIIVAVLALAGLPVSGGQINPIVSFTAGLYGLISLSRAAIYILMQSIGGVLGALALKVMLSEEIQRTYTLAGCTISVVTPGPNGSGPITTGIAPSRAFFIEAVCSFVFLMGSRWIAFDPRQATLVGRLAVVYTIGISAGLAIFVSSTVTGVDGYAGAGLNPARCLGPAVVRGGTLWDDLWIFWLAPALACFAFYTYLKIIPPEHFKPKEDKHDLLLVLEAISENKLRLEYDDFSHRMHL